MDIELGNVCKCRHNILGIVTKIHKRSGTKTMYYGISFAGKPWQSVKPEFIAKNVAEYVLQKLRDSVTEF